METAQYRMYYAVRMIINFSLVLQYLQCFVIPRNHNYMASKLSRPLDLIVLSIPFSDLFPDDILVSLGTWSLSRQQHV